MDIDCGTVWSDCLRVIAEQVPEQSFNTWFKPIVPVKCENDAITIQVPSQFFYEWLEEHYVQVLKKAITSVMGPQARLEYSVIVDRGNSKTSPLSVNLPNRNKGTDKVDNFSPFHLKNVDNLYQESQLNPNYTFDSYIEGDCNRLARSAGYAVAQKPGVTSFNPLMLYGGVGLGKTHLVQAIGNDIKSKISYICG